MEEINDEGIGEVKIQESKTGETEIIAKAGGKEARTKVKVKAAEIEKIV